VARDVTGRVSAMAGSNLRFLGNIALLFLLAAPAALAAPPTGGSGSDRDRDSGRQPRVDEMKTLGVDRNLAISGVQVSLFMGGDVVGRAVTESNGDYQLRAPYDPSNDVTVLLWFVAPDRTLMPKELVIQESRASLENGLISKCVPRASLSPGHQFRIYLFDSDSRNKELAESGCLP
jgi:hypothetical protein